VTARSAAVLRITRRHGTLELLETTVSRLRVAFDRVVVVGDDAAARALGAEGSRVEELRGRLGGAELVLLADDAWVGPLDDPSGWVPRPDGIAALVDHPGSWLLGEGAGVSRLLRGVGPDAAPLHRWQELDLLVRDAPIAPIEAFAASPLDHDARGLVMPRVADALAARGVPVDHVARSLAPVAMPRVLSSNLGLVEVISSGSGSGSGAPRPPALSIAVIMHVHYVEMLDELLERADHLPAHRLVVTTSDAARGAALERRLADLGRIAEVRVAESNRGRDISAFLIGCRDVLEDPSIDLVVKLHSKRSPQVGGMAGRSFAALLLDNLLPGSDHGARLVDLFANDPRLGIVFPPMIHAWYPTLGRAWFTNRPAAEVLAARLGITTPLDDASPIAPYGSMFAARPDALRPLFTGGIDWNEFPDEGEYMDGSLAHVLERLFVPAALTRGYSFRTVLSARWAAMSHASLELKLDAAEASVERRLGRKARRVPYKLGRVMRRMDPRR
jgi:hypothetical protein